jgi:uncharacterized protein (TIGR00251 family)
VSELEIAHDGVDACIVGVRAQPGAKRAGVVGEWNGHVKVAVGAPPERGRANAAVVAELARALGLPCGALALVSGERSRLKRVRVERPAAEVARRLLDLLA